MLIFWYNIDIWLYLCLLLDLALMLLVTVYLLNYNTLKNLFQASEANYMRISFLRVITQQ
jgi:hypothetical protein